MALTKDQYERLITAAERIASALENAAGEVGHIVSTIDVPPAEEPVEAQACTPEPATEPATAQTTSPAAEEAVTSHGEVHESILQDLNTWLFQTANWLTQNGKQGVSEITGVLQKNGINQVVDIKSRAQYDAIVADVTAMMKGA